MRRFSHGTTLIKAVVGLFSATTVLSVATMVWFRGNLTVETIVVLIFLLNLVIGIGAFDRFRIIRQPAVNRRSYLIVVAHPGDVIYGVGATMAKLWDSGHDMHVITLTNGRSDDDVNTLPERTRAWAEFLGCHSMTLGNVPVETVADNRDYLLNIIREQVDRYQPDVVFTHSRHESDPERALVAQLVLQATSCQQSVLGFRSPSTTAGFTADSVSEIKSYVQMKNHIAHRYHKDWDREATQETFEVIRTGPTPAF